MLKDISINLNNFFLSVSDAIDLSSPQISTHQMRVAYLSWLLAKKMKLPLERLKQIYIAALFHDIGALDPSDKLLLHRFEEKDLFRHCLRGERLFLSIPFLRPMAPIVRHHHTSWATWQKNGYHIEDPYVLESQLIYLADLVERLLDRREYVLHQTNRIIARIIEAAGQEIHPEVVDIFLDMAKRASCWLDLVSPRLYSILLNHGPLERVEIGLEDIAQLAAFFSKIIDFKSRFTSTHSTGVAACATILAHICALTEQEVLLMKIAGNLHDLGKLVIPNAILEKPGPLTPQEFAIIKQHTYHTYMILSSIEGFTQIAEWAAFHHEKLDGSGYPFGLTADRLSLGARIMAVADIFTALIERRPYRKEMSKKEVTEILKRQAQKGLLDSYIVKLLLENYQEVYTKVSEQQQIAQEKFQEYLQLPIVSMAQDNNVPHLPKQPVFLPQGPRWPRDLHR